MCLQDQGIDNDDGVVIRVRQARGHRDNEGCLIYDTSEASKTSTEAAGNSGTTTEAAASR